MQITFKVINIGDGLIVDYSEIDRRQGCGGSGYFAASTMDEVIDRVKIMLVDKDDCHISFNYDPSAQTPHFDDD
jgi:hypothetical protein